MSLIELLMILRRPLPTSLTSLYFRIDRASERKPRIIFICLFSEMRRGKKEDRLGCPALASLSPLARSLSSVRSPASPFSFFRCSRPSTSSALPGLALALVARPAPAAACIPATAAIRLRCAGGVVALKTPEVGPKARSSAI